MTKRRGFWLWLGIILLSLSAVLWLGVIGATVAEPGDAAYAVLAAVITTPLPIGFGVYCLVRARRLRAAEGEDSGQAKGTVTKGRGFWLWLGIILLSLSAVLWLGLIIAVATEPGDTAEAILGGVVVTVPPTGFGVYCLVRARRLRAAAQRNREQIIATRPQTAPARHRQWRAPAANIGAWEVVIFVLFVCTIFGLFAVAAKFGFPYWLWALMVYAAGTVFGALDSIARNRRERRQKEGVLAMSDDASIFVTSDTAEFALPDRKAVVDAVKEDVSAEEANLTRIRVDHRGNIPCVVQIRNSGSREIQFFDRDIWIKWTKGALMLEPVLKLPEKAKIGGRGEFEVATDPAQETVTIADEWARRILHGPSVAALGGTIRIEPDQVVWWTRAYMLPQEMLLKGIVDVLADVARKLESPQEY